MPRRDTASWKQGLLKLVEIHREDIESLPQLMALLRGSALPLHRVLRRPLIRSGRHQLQSRSRPCSKAASRGGPDNVVFYATSNRRHLMARDMMENERSTAINPGEAVEEKVSLSDRFGLWLGFHRCSQDEFSPWSTAMSPITAFAHPRRGGASAKRWNGRLPAVRARGGWRGSTCRISRAGWV